MNDPDFIINVLKNIDRMNCDDVLWYFDKEGGVHFSINCSDVFFWGSADCEEITPDNIHKIMEAKRDLATLEEGDLVSALYWDILFCARCRGERPQGAAYPTYKQVWPLLDACGPERVTGFGNPYKPGEYKK